MSMYLFIPCLSLWLNMIEYAQKLDMDLKSEQDYIDFNYICRLILLKDKHCIPAAPSINDLLVWPNCSKTAEIKHFCCNNQLID